MNRLTRRHLMALGFAAGAGALAGCGVPGGTAVNSAPVIPPAGPDETVRLTYWAWLKDLQNVCDVWNRQNPRIQVEAVWIPGGNAGGYQKLYSALTAGGGPDIGQVEMRSLPEFLLIDGLVDLSRYGFDRYRELYDPTLWQQVSYTGGVYGVPQDSGPMAFYYQTALLEAVGATPPTTWDDWASLARELRTGGSGRYLECFSVADASSFVAFATQAGARWLQPTDDGWVISMTDEATLQAARFFDTAVDDDLVDTSFGAFSPGWTAAAADGRIAAVTSASWADALIQSVGGGEGKWRVAPMPTWGSGGFGSSYQGGSTAAVMANSRHPHEAMEFCRWMTTSREGIDAMIENSGIGWSPSPDYIGASRQQPSPWFSGQNYNEEVFVPAAREQNPDWSWWPITQQTFNQLSNHFRRKLTDGLSFVDALALAQQDTIDTFRHKGLRIEVAA